MADHGHKGHVILEKRIYYRVFGVLLILTILTVAVASMDLGALNLFVAIAIAALKAALVVMYFMMLKYDSRVHTMVFAAGVLFLFVLIAFTMLDTELRGQFEPMERTTILERLRGEEELRQRDPGVPGGGLITPLEQEVETEEVDGEDEEEPEQDEP